MPGRPQQAVITRRSRPGRDPCLRMRAEAMACQEFAFGAKSPADGLGVKGRGSGVGAGMAARANRRADIHPLVPAAARLKSAVARTRLTRTIRNALIPHTTACRRADRTGSRGRGALRRQLSPKCRSRAASRMSPAGGAPALPRSGRFGQRRHQQLLTEPLPPVLWQGGHPPRSAPPRRRRVAALEIAGVKDRVPSNSRLAGPDKVRIFFH